MFFSSQQTLQTSCQKNHEHSDRSLHTLIDSKGRNFAHFLLLLIPKQEQRIFHLYPPCLHKLHAQTSTLEFDMNIQSDTVEELKNFLATSMSVEMKRTFLEAAIASLNLEVKDLQGTFCAIAVNHEQRKNLTKEIAEALTHLQVTIEDTKESADKKNQKIQLLLHIKNNPLCGFSNSNLYPRRYIRSSQGYVQIHPCLHHWNNSWMCIKTDTPVFCFLENHMIFQSGKEIYIKDSIRTRIVSTEHLFVSLLSHRGEVFGGTVDGIYHLKNLLTNLECVKIYNESDCTDLFVHQDYFFWDNLTYSRPISYTKVEPQHVNSNPVKLSAHQRLTNRVNKWSSTIRSRPLCDEALRLGEELGGYFFRDDGEMLAYVTKSGCVHMPLKTRELSLHGGVVDLTIGSNGEIALMRQVTDGYQIVILS